MTMVKKKSVGCSSPIRPDEFPNFFFVFHLSTPDTVHTCKLGGAQMLAKQGGFAFFLVEGVCGE